MAKAQADLATAKPMPPSRTRTRRAPRRSSARRRSSRTYYDQRVNAEGVADAAIKSAEAALTRSASSIVDHAYVKAPIAGRVSRAEITVGNLVQTRADAPLLTSDRVQ